MSEKLISRNLSLIVMIIIYCSFIHAQCLPDVLYYKFKTNCGNLTPNGAYPGRGNPMATIINQDLGPGGMIDSCIIGRGGVNNYVNTGWAPDIGTGNWTISFWVNNLVDLNPTYIFGNVSSSDFRCIYGGAAGSTNILLRGNFQDVLICCVMPGPTMIHLVYNGSYIKAYRNGILQFSYPRTGVNLSGTGSFEIGGYANHNCLNSGGKIDEFRVYNRALSDAEILNTWNIELDCITGMNQNTSIPKQFELFQNYPNPFNPTTTIQYGLPKPSAVKLFVYDETGKQIALLIDEKQQAGEYEIQFDGSNYPSGIYFYHLETEKYIETKKMILIK